MVTGGFRSVAGMFEALEGGESDLVGLARPLIVDLQAPRRLVASEIDKLLSPEATLNVFHILRYNNMQFERFGDRLNPRLFRDRRGRNGRVRRTRRQEHGGVSRLSRTQRGARRRLVRSGSCRWPR
jgi:hypothetical protein